MICIVKLLEDFIDLILTYKIEKNRISDSDNVLGYDLITSEIMLKEFYCPWGPKNTRHTNMYTSAHVYIYIYEYMCMHIYIYIYIHIYI
jgi:hypothetical protein